MAPTVRRARFDDAEFIARTVLSAQRGHVPRGWFDIALDRPEVGVPRLCGTDRDRTASVVVARFAIHRRRGRRGAGGCTLCHACGRDDRRGASSDHGSRRTIRAECSRNGGHIPARRLCGQLLGSGRRNGLAYRTHRNAPDVSRTRIGASLDRSRARGGKVRGLCARVDFLPDRERGGAAMLCESRLRFCGGETGFRFRGDNRGSRIPPLRTANLISQPKACRHATLAATDCGKSDATQCKCEGREAARRPLQASPHWRLWP